MDVINHDPNSVIVGLRVMLGGHDASRIPSYIEVFGRSVPISNVTRVRWFEVPLTRDESLQVKY